MNDDTNILPALRDRLDIIEIPAYSREEMVQIVKLHTLPEAIIDKGIPAGSITITYKLKDFHELPYTITYEKINILRFPQRQFIYLTLYKVKSSNNIYILQI